MTVPEQGKENIKKKENRKDFFIEKYNYMVRVKLGLKIKEFL